MAKHRKTQARQVEAVVISDPHLGTYGCKANDFGNYLQSISTPELWAFNNYKSNLQPSSFSF